MDASKRASQRPAGKVTRKRIPLSCLACRIRKLKCNREKPCQNCIVRGDAVAVTCTYIEKMDGKVSKSNPRSDAEDMRKRINRIESSIRQMMSGGADGEKSTYSMPLSSTSIHSTETLDGTGGQRLSVDTRSTHWDAILNDLDAMKDAWSEGTDHVEVSNDFIQPRSSKDRRPNLFNGLTELPDLSAVMSSIPGKEAVDKLITYFFENYNPSLPAQSVIYQPSFFKQYKNHWIDPKKSSVMWVGLLFAIMCYSMQSYRRNKTVPSEYHGTSETIMELYRIRAAQCLRIADITKPLPEMLQTYFLYVLVEYGDERDSGIGTYLLSGTLVRLALHQGYHRDPSQHTNISVFNGEIRRRFWNSIVQFEMLCCARIGLPRSLRYPESDTAEPRNLHKSELYEDMEVLPPSRPLTEHTPVSYTIVKGRIMRCYGRVLDFLHQLDDHAYTEVLKLDLALMEARESVPPYLQLRPLEEMKNDPPSLILERCNINQFYHKAVCLLHRKYWNSSPPDSDGTFFYSRKASMESAMALLSLQALRHGASLPDAPLTNMKWYHFAFTSNDFLLAAMIICLDLMSIQTTKQEYSDKTQYYNVPDIEKLSAIQKSRTIWSEVVDDCEDAKRAINILDRVLAKLTRKMEEVKFSSSAKPQIPIPISASATNPTVDSLRFSPYFTDQFGLGVPLVAPLHERDVTMLDTLPSESILDTLGNDLHLPADFDWVAWDQFVKVQSPPQTQNIVRDLPNELFQ